MSVVVYYFSGTGNSLAVARAIAEKVGGTLVPIASVVEQDRITTDADTVGIVFPVYYVGLCHIPLIVGRFVGKLENIGDKYVFAACTFGGGAGRTLILLDEMVRARGGRLAAGFGVQMPQNAFDKPFENRDKIIRKSKEKISAIAECVNARQNRPLRVDGPGIRQVVDLLDRLANFPPTRPFFVRPIYRMAKCEGNPDMSFADVTLNLDRSYTTDENCVGCGTCAKVCPVRNVEMANGKPVWHHRCENCLACINWCPKKAIHGYGELPGHRRYRHPEVKLSDVTWPRDDDQVSR
jgi:Pyruvate:ferredoxin oxidoreductase and related 2-oxoacid:ferredoxin oxidoreductases, delta subunit